MPLHKMTLHFLTDVILPSSISDDFSQPIQAIPVHHCIHHDSLPNDT